MQYFLLLCTKSLNPKKYISHTYIIKVVAIVQTELRRRKIVNAQPRFFESSSKLLQTFVVPESETKEQILERTEVKAKRIEEDHA
jgi:hypothetical protein